MAPATIRLFPTAHIDEPSMAPPADNEGELAILKEIEDDMTVLAEAPSRWTAARHLFTYRDELSSAIRTTLGRGSVLRGRRQPQGAPLK